MRKQKTITKFITEVKIILERIKLVVSSEELELIKCALVSELKNEANSDKYKQDINTIYDKLKKVKS